MFKSLFKLTESVGQIVIAPVEVAASLAEKAVTPVAEVVQELVDDIKSL